MSKDDDDDYEVGYGKPPKEHRFKPGQSGNESGRPKRHKNVKTIQRNALQQPVKVTINGETKTVSALEASIVTQVHRAVKGETKPFATVMAMATECGLLDEDGETSDHVSQSDRQIVDAALKRLAALEPPSDSEAEAEPDQSTDVEEGAEGPEKSNGDAT